MCKHYDLSVSLALATHALCVSVHTHGRLQSKLPAPLQVCDKICCNKILITAKRLGENCELNYRHILRTKGRVKKIL